MAGAVPETVLKKRKRDEEWATKKAAQQAEAKSKARASRKEIFKRAEQYVKEYREKVGAQPALCCKRGPGEQAAAGVQCDACVPFILHFFFLQSIHGDRQHSGQWCSGVFGKAEQKLAGVCHPFHSACGCISLMWFALPQFLDSVLQGVKGAGKRCGLAANTLCVC